MDDPRYPIGTLVHVPFSEAELERRVNHIAALPAMLESATQGLLQEDLQQPYRDGGWTIHQLVHHIADSHIQGFVRCKMALTMEEPTVSFYNQDAFVLMPDVQNVPINISLTLLHALHARWYELVTNVDVDAWQRKVYHPEQKQMLTAWQLLGMYAWHGRHHAMHIIRWRERNGR